MALGRAFTRRGRQPEISSPTVNALPGQIPSTPIVLRAVSVRKNGAPIKRSEISSPVQLISTTNMLSYNAPDIKIMQQQAHAEPANPRHSSEESDAPSTGSSNDSRATLTDASSVENSPISTPQDHENLSFFKALPTTASPAVKRSQSARPATRKVSEEDESRPALPQRAPSHSKKAHQHIARKKSVSHSRDNSHSTQGSSHRQTSSTSMSARMSREERASLDIFKVLPDPAHPFTKELEQLNEVAEDLNTVVQDVVLDEDQKRMLELGLGKFCADDYIFEIKPLFSGLFPERTQPAALWI